MMKLYTVKQVAELLNCSIHHVYSLCDKGHLKSFDIAMGMKKYKSYRISEDDLKDFLNKAKENAPAKARAVKPRFVKEI